MYWKYVTDVEFNTQVFQMPEETNVAIDTYITQLCEVIYAHLALLTLSFPHKYQA